MVDYDEGLLVEKMKNEIELKRLYEKARTVDD
jgi:hypothetical protein